MRLERLDLQAFGPFLKETSLDFSQFDPGQLLLVTGETGSGKTMLFDAIQYALYGEPSGALRSTSMLRSSSAKEDEKTWVRLTFSLGVKQYVVEREPSYLRVKKKGKGTTENKASSVLYEEGKLSCQGDEVTKRIVQLLGMTAKQFNQTLLIPQGEFRKLLSSDVEERMKILRQVFQTGAYANLEQRIREDYSAADKAYERLQERLDQLIAKVEEEITFEEGELCAGLRRAIEQDEQKLTEKEEQVKQLDQAQRELEQLVARLREQEALRTQASELKQELDSLDRIWQDLEAEGVIIEAEKERLPEWQAELKRLEQAFSLVAELRKLEEGLLALKQELDDGKREGLRLQGRIEEGKKLIESLPQLELTQKQGQKRQFELRQAVASVQALEQAQKNLEQHRQTLKEEREKQGHLEGQTLEAQALAQAQKADYLDYYERFLAAQAAQLAAQLELGQACPVCGSLAHPTLAHWKGELPEEAKLKELSIKKEKAEQEWSARQEDLRVMTERANWIEHQCAQQEAELESAVKEGVVESIEQLSVQLRKLQEEERQLVQELRALEQEIQKAEQVKRHLAELETKWHDLEQARAGRIAQQALLEKQCAERQAQLGSWNEAQAKQVQAQCLVQVSQLEKRESKFQARRQEILLKKTEVESLQKSIELRTRELGSIQPVEEGALEQAQSQLVMARAEERQLDYNLKRLKECLIEGEALTESLAQQREKLDCIEPLYRTFSQKNGLENYVQWQYFERIVEAANERFGQMTKGRLSLLRRKGDVLGQLARDKAKTLALDVRDSTTGTIRAVESLSGGEAFMASLSMALGLSDVVQADQGGLRLDSLFVDEGFGSLDAEALEQAMQALIGISERGCLVTLISHVEQLGDMIDQKVIVKKGLMGESTLSVQLNA